MGCVSSRLFRNDLREEVTITHGALNHVVSLTSSTYGLLSLDTKSSILSDSTIISNINKKSSPPRHENPEVINAWELMEGLEEEAVPANKKKNSPNSMSLFKGFADFNARSPLKMLNQFGSPMKGRRFSGKENGNVRGYSPKGSVKSKKALNMSKGSSPVSSSQRKSVSVSAMSEDEEEVEQIKRVVVLPSPNARKMRYCKRDCETMLKLFETKCPPGGENAVVIYTTTLRGIRKTFEDCNNVRAIVESHLVRVLERDISMDSGFKEEIRGLMGRKDVRVPLVFVKGRMIGGVDEIVKLEEEGKLGVLFDGIPKALVGCEGCAGMRFVMCVECNGSCKVMDEGEKKMVKCGECNENGLIHCPLCC